MLSKVALKLSKRLANNKVISEDLLDIYVYGFELIISSLVSTFFVLLFGIFLNKILQTVAFLTVFILLRSFSGGFHAKTYLLCSIITFTTYFVVIISSSLLIVNTVSYLTLLLIGTILLIILAPVENPNKKISEKKKKKFRIISLLLFILFISVGIALVRIIPQVSSAIFYTLVSDLILLFIKKSERKEI